MPSSPSAPPDFLTRRPFAHRGLHGGGVIENSRAAWDAAAAGGFGIECDVQASADGVAHVFHDDRLDRLTDKSGPVAERTAGELATICLNGTDETVPTLAEMLSRLERSVIQSRRYAPSPSGERSWGLSPQSVARAEAPPPTPPPKGRRDFALLIEIKSKGHPVTLCRGVARDLASYRGEAAIMSFDPRACRWFRRHAPARTRGLILTAQDRPGPWGRVRRWLALWWSDPHFIACDIRDLPLPLATRFRATGRPVLSWTVRTAAQRAAAASHADQIIFENPC